MKIAFYAFQWNCLCPKLTLEEFIKNLINKIDYECLNKKIYIVQEKKLFLGLILSIKDMHKFVTIVNSKQDIRLDVHQLNENEKIADFNFFILNPKTGFGLYQYYHNSCSLRHFCNIAKKYYNMFRKIIYDKEKKYLESQNLTDLYIKRSLSPYCGHFTYSIVERKEHFIERIKKLHDVSKIEFEFMTLDVDSSPFQAIYPHLKRHKHTFTFKKESCVTDKIHSIANLMSKDIKKATINGIDDDGNLVIYRLINDFDKFKEFDYETMVPSLRLNQDQIEDSIKQNDIIKELINVFNDIEKVL